MKKIAIIAGTRPEVIKLSPIIEAIKSENGLEPIVISSGQQGELLNQTLREFGIVPKFKAELTPKDGIRALSSERTLFINLATCFSRTSFGFESYSLIIFLS